MLCFRRSGQCGNLSNPNPTVPQVQEHPIAPTASAATATPLDVLRKLFKRLDEAGIRYCHWKSNEHLHAAMTGATDVDVLIDRRAAQRLTRILTDTSDFKRFVVKTGRGYPGIEDYVGFDQRSGMLTHLHLHYQLTLGEKFLKGHRLPWEELMLSTRVFERQHEVYIADPHLELLILIVRAAMKLRWRDYPLAMLGRRYFGGSMLRELCWLRDRVTTEHLRDLASPLVGPNAASLVGDMIAAGGPSIGQLLAVRSRARPRLSSYRMYAAPAATRRMWTRELTWIWWRGKHALLRAPTKSTRTLPHGGVAVAFVGTAAAGSSIARHCAEWLAHEVAVVLVARGSVRGFGRSAHRVQRARSLGMVVLCEEPSAGAFADAIIRYRKPGQESPHADVDIPPGSRLVDVDVSSSPERTQLQTKQAIWECL